MKLPFPFFSIVLGSLSGVISGFAESFIPRQQFPAITGYGLVNDLLYVAMSMIGGSTIMLILVAVAATLIMGKFPSSETTPVSRDSEAEAIERYPVYTALFLSVHIAVNILITDPELVELKLLVGITVTLGTLSAPKKPE